MQTAAYLNSKSTTVSQYVKLFQENSDTEIELLHKDFKDGRRYGEMQNAVATTWVISFKQIQRQNEMAANYMGFIACIANQDIPKDLLPELPELKRVEALGTLVAFGFLKEQVGERFYDMHRLVHLATQDWLRKEEQLSTWMQKSLSRLVDVIPYGGHVEWQTWTGYIPHGMRVLMSTDLPKDMEEQRILLGDKIGRCQHSIGQYKSAEEIHRYVFMLKKTGLGEEDSNTLISMNEIAQALSSQGKYVEAEKMHRETLVLKEKVLGNEHPETLTSMYNLANALRQQGKYPEADAIYQGGRFPVTQP